MYIIIVISMHQTVTILHEWNDSRGTQLSRPISAVTDDDLLDNLLDITGGKSSAENPTFVSSKSLGAFVK